jgi:simple sugar transport system substrate-binding protein
VLFDEEIVMKRCLVVLLAVASVVCGCGKPSEEGGKPAGKKMVVGFAQTGAESGWRLAHTGSVKGEAAKRGVDLKFVDGQNDQSKQIKALYSFINQGVDAIILSPIKEEGWDQVLKEAKEAGIPVLLLDRTVEVKDESLYEAFIGSDFVKEGEMAGEWLANATKGKCTILELEGTPGSAPAVDRAAGFRKAIKAHPEMKIIESQSGDFRRANGKEIMAAMLNKHSGKINVVYAHNDDMAIGAIQAIEDAGLKPGKDIIIVSVDALGEALKLVVEGKINCTVQCNPLLGPDAFDAVERILAGEKLPKAMYMKDTVYDKSNAAEALKDWKY